MLLNNLFRIYVLALVATMAFVLLQIPGIGALIGGLFAVMLIAGLGAAKAHTHVARAFGLPSSEASAIEPVLEKKAS